MNIPSIGSRNINFQQRLPSSLLMNSQVFQGKDSVHFTGKKNEQGSTQAHVYKTSYVSLYYSKIKISDPNNPAHPEKVFLIKKQEDSLGDGTKYHKLYEYLDPPKADRTIVGSLIGGILPKKGLGSWSAYCDSPSDIDDLGSYTQLKSNWSL